MQSDRSDTEYFHVVGIQVTSSITCVLKSEFLNNISERMTYLCRHPSDGVAGPSRPVCSGTSDKSPVPIYMTDISHQTTLQCQHNIKHKDPTGLSPDVLSTGFQQRKLPT
jgi:hypothetical protein